MLSNYRKSYPQVGNVPLEAVLATEALLFVLPLDRTHNQLIALVAVDPFQFTDLRLDRLHGGCNQHHFLLLFRLFLLLQWLFVSRAHLALQGDI